MHEETGFVSEEAAARINAARQAGGAMGIAIFGALAGGSVDRIIPGLRAAALVSAGLLAVAALLAHSIRPHPGHPARARPPR